MIRKLRLKFVLNNMITVGIMLSIMLGMVLYFTGNQIREGTMSMLRTMDPNMVGRVPRSPANKSPELRLPTFAIRINEDGSFTISGDGYYDFGTDDSLAEDLIERTEGSDEGVIEEYQLRYLRRGDSIVFADMTSESNAMSSLRKNCIIIGLVALTGCFFISLGMAYWATRPVEQAWNQQKQFVADASHDLRTPLTVIMTNAEMLPDSQMSEGIRKMSLQMKGLVENLLELARLDTPSAEDNRKVFCLSDTAENACMCFEVLFFEEGLTLESKITPDVYINGNEEQMNRLLSILLDNAKKYCDEGTTTTVTLTEEGKNCRLCVANVGRQLSEEERKNFFKRFYRGDKARGQNRSYGLGLSIAEGIVQLHKGKIWCESENGINSFIVTIPVQNASTTKKGAK